MSVMRCSVYHDKAVIAPITPLVATKSGTTSDFDHQAGAVKEVDSNVDFKNIEVEIRRISTLTTDRGNDCFSNYNLNRGPR